MEDTSTAWPMLYSYALGIPNVKRMNGACSDIAKISQHGNTPFMHL